MGKVYSTDTESLEGYQGIMEKLFFVKALASKWPLRGADLWHLATAKTLQKDLPELTVLTFDNRLYVAALGEKLAA